MEERISIARSLKKAGVSDQVIANNTGLSLEQIKLL